MAIGEQEETRPQDCDEGASLIKLTCAVPGKANPRASPQPLPPSPRADFPKFLEGLDRGGAASPDGLAAQCGMLIFY